MNEYTEQGQTDSIQTYCIQYTEYSKENMDIYYVGLTVYLPTKVGMYSISMYIGQMLFTISFFSAQSRKQGGTYM